MSRSTVQLTRAAVKDLDDLPGPARGEETSLGRPSQIKRLKGFPFLLYRLRSGDYRVLYRVDEALVTVMRVINRKDLERALRRLGLPRR
ncbi:MAG: type II toxin-antitoxin system RelE/ParE family toxin [bacterium]|nr:type II toxin-antitoxin system RelE/ParE family toxin [bacterium]